MKLFLETGTHDYEKYKEIMRQMIMSRGSSDFFEKYICSQYGSLLGFNISLDICPVVGRAIPDNNFPDFNMISLVKL